MTVAPIQSGSPLASAIAPIAPPPTSLVAPPVGTMDPSDALSALLKLSSDVSAAQTDTSRQSVMAAASQRKEAADRRQKALQDAIDAQKRAEEEKSKGGFFDFITDNLGPVGLVGMVIGSVYLVAADVALHAAGIDDGKMDLADAAGLGAMLAGPAGIAVYAAQMLVKKVGPEELQDALDQGPTLKDSDVAAANRIAFAVTQAELAIAATVASGGTCAPAVIASVGIAVSTTTQILQDTGALRAAFGDKAAGYIAMGGSIAGAACSLGAGASALATSQLASLSGVATAAEAGVSVAKGAHDVVQGIRNYEAAGSQFEADQHTVDAERQKHVLAFIERSVDDLISAMKDLKESARRTTELIQGAMQTETQTLLVAGSLKV